MGAGQAVVGKDTQKLLWSEEVSRYNLRMNVLASTLVALSIFDLFPVTPASLIVPTSSYAQTGVGELTVQITNADGIGSVARGASRVPLASLEFIASCDADIAIESIDLRHTGLGATTDIHSVYLTDGLRRVTRAQRFDTKRSILTLRFSHPFTLKRCDVRRLSVMVDVSSTATVASEHSVALVPGTIRSSAKTVTIDERQNAPTVVTTPFQAGSISLRFLDLNRPLRYGRRERVARLQISADAKQSHLLRKITLTNNGSARDMNLVQFTLEKSDGVNLIAPAMRMHGRTVALEFSPSFPLARGQTVVLNLVAEVRGRHSDTVQFMLEEPSDLVAIPSNLR